MCSQFYCAKQFGCFLFSFLVQKITANYNNIFPSFQWIYSSLSDFSSLDAWFGVSGQFGGFGWFCVIAMCPAVGWDGLCPIVGCGWGGKQNLKYCQTGFKGWKTLESCSWEKFLKTPMLCFGWGNGMEWKKCF